MRGASRRGEKKTTPKWLREIEEQVGRDNAQRNEEKEKKKEKEN
jgi:hypothetical protein